jgi:hypothetical protein
LRVLTRRSCGTARFAAPPHSLYVIRNKMKNTYPLNELEIPLHVTERDGPFSEFKQDTSFVTVELSDGKNVPGVLLLFPNYVIAVEGETDLPFSPKNVVRITQTKEDLNKRSSSEWSYFYNPEEFSKRG